MTLPKTKMYVNCKKCGKTIELKAGRTLCIRCRNLVDKENAEKRRQTQESKEYMKKRHKENRGR